MLKNSSFPRHTQLVKIQSEVTVKKDLHSIKSQLFTAPNHARKHTYNTHTHTQCFCTCSSSCNFEQGNSCSFANSVQNNR